MLDSSFTRYILLRSALVQLLAVALFTFVSALFFCQSSGALDSDLGGDPDEAAHAVTSLMVRDYLVDELGQHPMKFARTYYDHFPRVALGHFPPFFYLIAGMWLLPFCAVKALFVLQSALLALLAALTFHVGRRFLSVWGAALASVLGCALPVSLKLVQIIMSDIMLAVLCLFASILWADYLRVPTLKKSISWGFVAAAAVLTKGSGMLLCLLPPLATVFVGRAALMRSLSWWSSALPVALLAGPWMLYSTSISKEGMTGLTPSQYLIDAVPYYLSSIPLVFGWGITLLALLGAAVGVRQALSQRSMSAEAASLTALMTGTFAVLVLVPVGLTTRYMLTLVPAFMLLAAFGVQVIGRKVPPSRSLLLEAALFIGAFAIVFSLPQKAVHGFSEAVCSLVVQPVGNAKQNWLVSSDPRGEGAVIAAAAFQSSKRYPSLLKVFRGGKELASSDWMGRDYHAAVNTPEELLRLLDELRITSVLLDFSVPETQRRQHDVLLGKTLSSAVTSWKLEHEIQVTRRPNQTGQLLIYNHN